MGVIAQGRRRIATARTPSEVPAAERRWLLYVLLLLGLVLAAGPFVWMLLGSLKSQSELQRLPPTWWPEDASLDNFRRLFDRVDFLHFGWNSVVVATVVTASNLLFCSMLGYALAKLEFFGKNKLLLLVLATVMVPGSVLLVPQFVLIAKLDLVNTFAALILPTAVGAFGVFLMRQAMQSIPDELLEAGRIDGAGEFYLFFRVVLPLVVPTMATLGILVFLGSWNNFLWPLVVSTDEDKYTLPVALAIFTRGEYQADYGLLMAGSVVLVLPVLVLFILLQRYFRQGIATTGLKG